MTSEIVERVRRSARYRDVDPALLDRLAGEELPRARNVDDAVKRVKRRLHQAIGAYRGAADVDRVLEPIRAAWSGDLADEAFRAACRVALARHASTAERLPNIDRFFAPIWELTGAPRMLLDLACGLGPLSLPWMGLVADATYRACDADRHSLAVVEAFLTLVGQPAAVEGCDLVASGPPTARADVALLLKLIPLLDRQEPSAAARCLAALDAGHAVVSFPARSLGGRRRGMEATYRRRLDDLVAELGIREVREASVPNELVFVLTLDG
jgi:16S rRNA (guanine(1405)-N(7))-methyltransferase